MLLADFAQVSDGKLTIVGGGWSLTGPERATAQAYDALLAAARSGRLSRASLERSAARIDELAATYAG